MSRSVLDQAQDVQGVVSAARFRDRMARREANATDDGDRRAAREAIFDVEERFPDLHNVPVGGAERFARERGHGKGARTPTHEGRHRPRKPDAEPLERAANKAGTPKKGGGSGRTSAPRERGTGSGRAPSRGRSTLEGRARSRGARAWRETGIPGAGASASSILMSLFGGTVGLAALYLVTTGKGSATVESGLHIFSGGLNRVIAPKDFFGPGLTATQEAAALNPHGVAAGEEASLAAAGHSSLPVRPGIHVNGHPLRPHQLGFKK